MILKECTVCKTLKSESEFSKRNDNKGPLQSYCKPCYSTYRKNRRKKMAASNTPKKPVKKRQKFTNEAAYIRDMIVSAIKRAVKDNIPYNIDKLDPTLLKLPSVCPVLGIPLFKGKKRPGDNSPSLDRIYPNKGYMIDNIHIISWKANRIKNDASTEELRKIVDYFEKIDQVVNKGV